MFVIQRALPDTRFMLDICNFGILYINMSRVTTNTKIDIYETKYFSNLCFYLERHTCVTCIFKYLFSVSIATRCYGLFYQRIGSLICGKLLQKKSY